MLEDIKLRNALPIVLQQALTQPEIFITSFPEES